MITLRIGMIKFTENRNTELLSGSDIINELFIVDQAPSGPHLYGLPFSIHDFLTICDECEKSYTGDRKAAVLKFEGSQNLFSWTVADLSVGRVDLKDFFGDQIPAHLENSTGLLRVLASTQGDHTQNFEIDYMQFIKSIAPSNGPLVGPMSHFQAAAFVQQFQSVPAPMEVMAWASVPNSLCKAGVLAYDFVLLRNTCRCGNYVGRCCLMMQLIKQGPLCFVCRTDRVEWIKSRPRKK
jgi:hypothetical protein